MSDNLVHMRTPFSLEVPFLRQHQKTLPYERVFTPDWPEKAPVRSEVAGVCADSYGYQVFGIWYWNGPFDARLRFCAIVGDHSATDGYVKQKLRKLGKRVMERAPHRLFKLIIELQGLIDLHHEFLREMANFLTRRVLATARVWLTKTLESVLSPPLPEGNFTSKE
jgi:hypothetical protein